jgi:hypothetical protein
MIEILSGGECWGLHLGTRGLAARAYAGRWGQLLGTQIPHALRSAGSVCALMIAMVRPAFRATAVANASGSNHPAACFRTTALRAVDLTPVTPTTHAKERRTKPATGQPMIVHAPAPARTIVGPDPTNARWSVPLARPRDREG